MSTMPEGYTENTINNVGSFVRILVLTLDNFSIIPCIKNVEGVDSKFWLELGRAFEKQLGLKVLSVQVVPTSSNGQELLLIHEPVKRPKPTQEIDHATIY